MTFLSSETLSSIIQANNIIQPYSKERIHQGAYELSVGKELFVTCDKKDVMLKNNEKKIIPPGQLALLLTEEVISIPNNMLAFISVKASKKIQGLINVSGFHVDPGFSGKLKFTVYNAGASNIIIQPGDVLFMIWFSLFDQPTNDIYKGVHQNQSHISSAEVEKMQGKLASPAELKVRLDKLDFFVALGGVALSAIGVMIALLAISLSPILQESVSNFMHRSSGQDVASISPRSETEGIESENKLVEKAMLEAATSSLTKIKADDNNIKSDSILNDKQKNDNKIIPQTPINEKKAP